MGIETMVLVLGVTMILINSAVTSVISVILMKEIKKNA